MQLATSKPLSYFATNYNAASGDDCPPEVMQKAQEAKGSCSVKGSLKKKLRGGTVSLNLGVVRSS